MKALVGVLHHSEVSAQSPREDPESLDLHCFVACTVYAEFYIIIINPFLRLYCIFFFLVGPINIIQACIIRRFFQASKIL